MVGDAEQRQERVSRTRHGLQGVRRNPRQLVAPLRRLHRPSIHRGLVGQRGVRHVGDDNAAFLNPQPPVVRDLANLDRVQVPLLEHALHFRLAAALDDEQHALLRFRQHDLVRRHAGFPLRHARDVDFHADAAARSGFRRRARQARGAHVLHADARVGRHHLEARLEQQLLHERIADLHGRAFVRRTVVELGRRHRGAVDAVAARLGADVVHRIADAARHALDERVMPRQPEAEHVDERIASVRLVEHDLAADGGDPDAVAVAADAAHDAVEDTAASRVLDRAEAQRVEQRDGPRAHREDVADDAADAGRRALIRLDERRMIVRLDLEHRREAVADVDGARVLARPLQHARTLGRQRAQVDARTLVAAMLGPHHREQPELRQVGLAPDELDNARVLVAGQAMALENGLVDHREHFLQRAALRQRMHDGLEQDQPVLAAQRGLARPLRVRHQADHVPRRAADTGDAVQRSVGIGLIGRLAERIGVAEDDAAGRLERGQHLGRRVVVALAVRNRHPEHLSDLAQARERRVRPLDADADELAMKLDVAVAQHRPGQQAALEQNLKPVADAQHGPSGRRERGDGGHHRREARDGAGAQVVAMGKPAGQHDDVGAVE